MVGLGHGDIHTLAAHRATHVEADTVDYLLLWHARLGKLASSAHTAPSTAPVRRHRDTASPTWSAWSWVTSTISTSPAASAATPADGAKKGSIITCAPGALILKADVQTRLCRSCCLQRKTMTMLEISMQIHKTKCGRYGDCPPELCLASPAGKRRCKPHLIKMRPQTAPADRPHPKAADKNREKTASPPRQPRAGQACCAGGWQRAGFRA